MIGLENQATGIPSLQDPYDGGGVDASLLSPGHRGFSMDNGWIKLHRKIEENPIVTKPVYAWLFMMLLIRARHEDGNFLWNGTQMYLKKGQLVTGRIELSKLICVPQTTIERAMTWLENGHYIGQQKTTKYRVISIVNWEKYQTKDTKSDNKRTTNGQQTDTNKNVKNYKNDKNTSKAIALRGNQWNTLIDGFKEVNPLFSGFYENKTERAALEYLAKKIGYEKLEATIRALPELTSKPYAPKITKPSELKRDLGKLIVFYKQSKEDKTKYGGHKIY